MLALPFLQCSPRLYVFSFKVSQTPTPTLDIEFECSSNSISPRDFTNAWAPLHHNFSPPHESSPPAPSGESFTFRASSSSSSTLLQSSTLEFDSPSHTLSEPSPAAPPPVAVSSPPQADQGKRDGRFNAKEEELLKREFHAWILQGVPRKNMDSITAFIRREPALRGRSYRCVYFKLKRMHAAKKRK